MKRGPRLRTSFLLPNHIDINYQLGKGIFHRRDFCLQIGIFAFQRIGFLFHLLDIVRQFAAIRSFSLSAFPTIGAMTRSIVLCDKPRSIQAFKNFCRLARSAVNPCFIADHLPLLCRIYKFPIREHYHFR